MTEASLLETGNVSAALRALSTHLRDNPEDVQRRTLLFELLCFAGQYERAEKQLTILAQGSKESELGAVLYYSALHAEKTRHETFRSENFPSVSAPPSLPGTCNGRPFRTLQDADHDIGARLEVFVAGAYTWIPLQHIVSVHMEPPRRLRDMLWTPASIMTGPGMDADLGEVLIPAIYPFSWKSEDESLWLGRRTEWVADDEGHEFPVGQKMFLLDGEEVPLLEIRSLEFTSVAVSNAAS